MYACKVAYTGQVTFDKVAEQHGHVDLVGFVPLWREGSSSPLGQLSDTKQNIFLFFTGKLREIYFTRGVDSTPPPPQKKRMFQNSV